MKRLLIVVVLCTITLAFANGTPRVLLFMRSGSADLEYMLKTSDGTKSLALALVEAMKEKK